MSTSFFPYHKKYRGRHMVVMGLGKSGLCAAQTLHRAGACVYGWDDNEKLREKAQKEGIPVANPMDPSLLKKADALILSPGIPHTHPVPHPVTDAARHHHVPLIGDIEILMAADQTERPIIAITATNGKSTTTALIGHLLQYAGYSPYIGGNLGTPALSFDLQRPDPLVLELSSYQLELTPSLHSDFAILLNISPDHLERHGGMDGYIAVKNSIFTRCKVAALIGVDDPCCREIAENLPKLFSKNHKDGPAPRLVPFSGYHMCKGGVYVQEGYLIDDLKGAEEKILSLQDVSALPGAHNAQNIAAAWAFSRLFGLEKEKTISAIQTFPGLPHRQEIVATCGHIRFVNDSKATNAEAAAKALGCYGRIHWIAGGRAKDENYDVLAPYVGRIHHACLIGESAPDIANWLAAYDVPHTICHTMDKAVRKATQNARMAEADSANDNGDMQTVLLSPACASFDQYCNFEARGKEFTRLALHQCQEEAC